MLLMPFSTLPSTHLNSFLSTVPIILTDTHLSALPEVFLRNHLECMAAEGGNGKVQRVRNGGIVNTSRAALN